MSAVPSPQQKILFNLQMVFAFLSCTQRPAYAPSTFLTVARPPWFPKGFQQDCSEFLRYLLDQEHEEEKLYSGQKLDIGPKQSKGNVSGGGLNGGNSGNTSDIDSIPMKRLQPNNTKIESAKISGKTTSESVQLSSLVQRIFGGKMEHSCHCLECGAISRREEVFTDLPLAFSEELLRLGRDKASLEVDKSLYLLIEHFFKTEKMIGDNRYFCDRLVQKPICNFLS